MFNDDEDSNLFNKQINTNPIVIKPNINRQINFIPSKRTKIQTTSNVVVVVVIGMNALLLDNRIRTCNMCAYIYSLIRKTLKTNEMGAKVSIKSEDDQLENDEYKSDRNIHFRKCSGVLKDLCAYQPEKADATIRLPHSCYMILIGRLKNQDDMNIIRAMNESVGITSNRENDLNQIEYTIMQSEYIEAIFEYITLQHTTQQIQQSRRTHLVYEDNFNQSLFDIVQMNSSYDKLKAVCRKYLQSEDVDEAMHTHQCRVNKTYSYFSDKGLSDNESKALAFSLSFYTGTRSEACNRSASLIAHRAHSQVVEQRTEEEINEAAIIVYYLVKALSYIPFYWGHVTRACQLTDEELLIYRPGSLITWIQFSSSKKGKQVVNSKMFQNRNVLFKIYSLTGRPIQQFSNYEEEDEVLFLPHSTFLIFNRKTFPKQKKHVIYMRQVELGLCEWSVLWVDDKIFDENWENKQHMEYAAIKALDINVHFIPKSDTDTALSFLRSPFGQRLKNEKTFRIVTDMNRDNERCPHNAGARFIMALRQLGFNNQCLVFTGNQQQAQQHLRTLLNSHQQQNLQVSQQTNDLRRFINFDREATRTTNIQVSMFNNINTNIHLLRRNLNKQFSFQNRNK